MSDRPAAPMGARPTDETDGSRTPPAGNTPEPAVESDSPASLRQRFGEAASMFGKLDTRPFDERNRPAPWWSRWLRRR
ncbi:MAG: hypothetical protein J7603_09925 [Pseudacidovorax sp.]|nr:hypothetical protein [Pseudacidovorax sp.]